MQFELGTLTWACSWDAKQPTVLVRAGSIQPKSRVRRVPSHSCLPFLSSNPLVYHHVLGMRFVHFDIQIIDSILFLKLFHNGTTKFLNTWMLVCNPWVILIYFRTVWKGSLQNGFTDKIKAGEANNSNLFFLSFWNIFYTAVLWFTQKKWSWSQ